MSNDATPPAAPPVTFREHVSRDTLRGYIAKAGGPAGIEAGVNAALGMATLVPGLGDAVTPETEAAIAQGLAFLYRFVDSPTRAELTITLDGHPALVLTVE